MPNDFWAKNWEKVITYGFSIFFVVVFALLLLGIVIFVPNPTTFQEYTFRLILTLVAGMAGVFIPGFLHIEGKIGNIALRASGAIALAVLVYIKNPPALIRESTKAKQDVSAKPSQGN